MSSIHSFLGGKCPQCHEGNVFTHKASNLKHFREMHDHCPSCNVKFESEPGFFWGAMYFSYAYSVASFIIIGFFFFTYSDDVNLGTATSPMDFSTGTFTGVNKNCTLMT